MRPPERYSSVRLNRSRSSCAFQPFQVFGLVYEPLLTGAAVLLIFWLILFWMYRRKIFLRI